MVGSSGQYVGYIIWILGCNSCSSIHMARRGIPRHPFIASKSSLAHSPVTWSPDSGTSQPVPSLVMIFFTPPSSYCIDTLRTVGHDETDCGACIHKLLQQRPHASTRRSSQPSTHRDRDFLADLVHLGKLFFKLQIGCNNVRGLVIMTDAFAQWRDQRTQQSDPSPTIDRLVTLVVGHGDQIAGCSSQRLQLNGRFSDGDTRQSAAPKYAVQEGVSRHFGIILRKHVSAPAYLIRADPIARRESPHATTQRDAFLA